MRQPCSRPLLLVHLKSDPRPARVPAQRGRAIVEPACCSPGRRLAPPRDGPLVSRDRKRRCLVGPRGCAAPPSYAGADVPAAARILASGLVELIEVRRRQAGGGPGGDLAPL